MGPVQHMYNAKMHGIVPCNDPNTLLLCIHDRQGIRIGLLVHKRDSPYRPKMVVYDKAGKIIGYVQGLDSAESKEKRE